MEKNIKFVEGGVVAPKGFLAAGVHCGLRKNKTKKDLAMIFSKEGRNCAAAAVYTENKVAGAPITATRAHLQNGYAKALICNSGIANTCAPGGLDTAYAMCKMTAEALGINPDDVIVASTGVIGSPLPLEPIQNALPALVGALGDTGEAGEGAAIAIMTTDTRKKEYAVEFELDGHPAKIGLIAKGSGMIEPNMATMLCFATTDAAISPEMLKEALGEVVADTFNMVSIDGDTSTNDMVSVMASGLCGNEKITEKNGSYGKFKEALFAICEKVSQAIAFDGEGATKLLECKILNANSKRDAKKLAKSVIKSSLVKSMMFGADANGGRVLCALGYAGVEFDPLKIDAKFASAAGEIEFCKSGEIIALDEEKAKGILSREIIEIIIDMQAGNESATAWGCDLSYEYVRINGDYRS